METIDENSVVLNWDDNDEIMNPTRGDTTFSTYKDNNNINSTGDGELLTSDNATYEDDCCDSGTLLEQDTKVGNKRKCKGNHWTDLYDETTKMYPFAEFSKNTRGYKAIELAKILYEPLDLCNLEIIVYILNRTYGGNFRNSNFKTFISWVEKYFKCQPIDLSGYRFPAYCYAWAFLEKLDKVNNITCGKDPDTKTKTKTSSKQTKTSSRQTKRRKKAKTKISS